MPVKALFLCVRQGFTALEILTEQREIVVTSTFGSLTLIFNIFPQNGRLNLH